jgi:D-alanyl-D-alanine carboxypeptidase (penicillin-binding protein 5/6)
MKKKLFSLIAIILTVCMLIPSMSVGAATFKTDFPTTSKALELINLDTGTTVFQKNADQKEFPASTTKIMTYIVTVENVKDLDTKVTVPQSVIDSLSGTGSSMAGLIGGETLTVLQLLNCMMVPSANDAAAVLADFVGGGDTNKFVEMMNKKAKELGCKNTNFVNPHGLHDPNHYTTADDMCKIARYAMTLPHFAEITSEIRYFIPVTNKSKVERPLSTTNKLIQSSSSYYYKYAKGIKTGSTDEAGYCLVSSAVKPGSSYLCVALGAPEVDTNGKPVTTNGAMVDSKKLYEWAFEKLKLKTVINSTDKLGEVKLAYAWNKDTLAYTAEKSYATILPNDVDASSVITTPHLPKSVSAPIKKGQVIGTATVSYAGQELTTVNLVAAESVERSELLHTVDAAKSIFTSTWFLIIVALIVILLIIYIILAIVYNRKKKNLRRVKKYRKM